jgi:type I restriction enzyme S subunit
MNTIATAIKKEKARIPKLRFREFEGEWSVNKFLKLVNSISSGKVKPKEEGEFQVYGSTGIIGNSDEFTHEGEFLLVARVGANAGKINKVNGKFGVTDNTLIIDLKKEIEVAFCESFLIRFNLNRLIFGSGQPLITGGLLKSLNFISPSLPEQQKIAAFLSAVDEKIQQLTKKKALLELYKKGVMQKLFSQKLRFKNENGNEYPDWEEKMLGEVLTIGSGRDHKHLETGDVPVFGTGGFMRSVNEKLFSGETVFIGRKGTIDKPFYFKGDFWTVDTLFYTHKFKNVLPKFIYAIFQQVNWKLYNEASGVPSLSKSTIENIKFKFPVIEEQQKIATYLSSIDAKIEAVNNQISHSQIFKKGLLQQMFV